MQRGARLPSRTGDAVTASAPPRDARCPRWVTKEHPSGRGAPVPVLGAVGAVRPPYGAPNTHFIFSSTFALGSYHFCPHKPRTQINNAQHFKPNLTLLHEFCEVAVLPHRQVPTTSACEVTAEAAEKQNRSCNNSVVNVCAVHAGTRPVLGNNSDTPP